MALKEPVIKTKIKAPALRQDLTFRTRLLDQLRFGLFAKEETGFSRRLTLVSAPAGYGKTTLLRSWIESNNRAAWLTLDRKDNNIRRFYLHLISSLQLIEPDIEKLNPFIKSSFAFSLEEAAEKDDKLVMEELLVNLVNELAEFKKPLFLILDDYHLIDEEQIHSGLSFLVENVPPTFHLVIATRFDPPLSLALWRGKGWINEIRQKDLRFNNSEAVDLFSTETICPRLTAEQTALLTKRTEGWATGLQVAAISLTGKEEGEIDNFINEFSGSSRYLLDYLAQEILEQQTPTIKEFLIKTAILEDLSPALCQAVTGAENSQQILKEMVNKNLFIVTLDGEKNFYRYHALFKELLLNILQNHYKDELNSLHISAAIWYRSNGFIPDAIEHALAGNDYLLAMELLETHGEGLFNRGEQINLVQWIETIPEQYLMKNPYLLIFESMLLYLSGEPGKAKSALETAGGILNDKTSSYDNTRATSTVKQNTDIRALQGMHYVASAFLQLFSGDYNAMADNSAKALKLLPESKTMWRLSVSVISGDIDAITGKLHHAADAYNQALIASRRSGDQFFALMSGFKLARVYFYQGRFTDAENLCSELLNEAENYGFARTARAGNLQVILGMLACERNRIEQALDYVKQGLFLIERENSMLVSGWAKVCLAGVHLSRDELDLAETAIREAEICGSNRNLAYVENLAAAYKTRLWLIYSRSDPLWIDEAYRFMQTRNLPVKEGLNFFRIDEYLSLIRVLIAARKGKEARQILDQLIRIARNNGITFLLMEALLLSALTYTACEETGNANEVKALKIIEQAFEEAGSRAIREGFTRVFINEGPPLAKLLYKALQKGVYPEFIGKLLLAFPEVPGPLHGTQVSQEKMIEPLSDRELEILKLISSGRSNQEISTQLYLSMNTVKWHLRNIYGKLGAENRTDAAARARSLDLLD